MLFCSFDVVLITNQLGSQLGPKVGLTLHLSLEGHHVDLGLLYIIDNILNDQPQQLLFHN